MIKSIFKRAFRFLGYEIRKIPKGEIIKSKNDQKFLFNYIYKNNIWGGVKGAIYSGPGSDDNVTTEYINCIKDFIKVKQIKTIVDVGCGDFRVGKKLISDDISYYGVDVSNYVIEKNKLAFEKSNLKFICLNATKDILPDGDLCLIRQVLQHLSNNQILNILENVSKYKYIIITEHIPVGINLEPNKDIENGWDTRLSINSGVFLEQNPFNMKTETLLEINPNHIGFPTNVLRTSLIIK